MELNVESVETHHIRLLLYAYECESMWVCVVESWITDSNGKWHQHADDSMSWEGDVTFKSYIPTDVI